MTEAIRVAKPAGFIVFSVAVHLLMAASCVLFAQAKGPRPTPLKEYDISLEPALGRANGSAQGKGLGSRIAQADISPAMHRQPRAATARLTPTSHDPNAIATAKSDAAKPQALASNLPPVPAAPGLASTAAPGGDPASPVGSVNLAAGIGRPDGTEGGTGMGPPKPRMTAQYKGMLAGWFGARFTTRGLGLPFDELRKLRVRATISLSPERRVTGFSLGSSGNGAFDEQVRRTLNEIQSSGQTLPSPPDDSVLPPSFPISFQCTDERRCS